MKKQNGFTLIEVLVAIVLLGIGLLGVAGLQIASLQTNQGAFNRSQASFLVADIADRMRLNPEGVAADAYKGIDTNNAASIAADPGCIDSGCSGEQLAIQDIREWANEFIEVGALGGGAADPNYLPSLPQGRGQIDYDAVADTYTISISWIDITSGTDDSLSLTISL